MSRQPLFTSRRIHESPAALVRRAARVSSAVMLAAAVAATAACASANPGGSASAQGTRADSSAWIIKTRDQIDLWMHGYAMLQADSARVPYFRRGYRDELVVYKNQRDITTLLDQNRERLAARFEARPALVNSQFLALYFANWDEMRRFMDMFFVAEGDPRRASNPSVQQAISIIAGYFPTAADREWARTFVQSLQDEYTRYYRAYWSAEQQQRSAALAAVDSLWREVYYPKLKRFLDGSQQRRGDIMLSITLNGEGRLLPGGPTSPGGNHSYLAINFPDSPATATHAIYVLAHEVAGKIVNTAVSDHTTPAERREGITDRYEADGLVLGGYFLLKRVLPELAEGYARYYLDAARVQSGAEAVEAALLAAFPLPQVIRDSMVRQIDAVLSGI